MLKHWKRAVEFASPAALAPFFLLSTIWPGAYDWDWSWVTYPLHRLWLFVLTGLLWIAAVIVLRPLSADYLVPRIRFSFISALVGSWLFALAVIDSSRWTDQQGNYKGLADAHCFVPAAILVWGIRERLTARQPRDPRHCAYCDYPRAGLASNASCPECGRAPVATSSPNNLT